MPVFDEGQQCIADLDGVDGKTTNLRVFKSYTKQCLMRYYWEYAYNCIRRGYFVDPRKRDCHYSSKYRRKQGGVLCHLSYNQSCDML